MYAVDNVFELLTDSAYLKFGPGNSDDPDWGGLIGPGGVTTSVDLRESRSNLARTDGEVIGPSYWGNRTVVMDILIPEPDPVKRGRIIDRIYRACRALQAPDMNNGLHHLQWTEQDGQIYGADPLLQYTVDDPTSEFYAEPGDEDYNPATYYGTPKRLPVKLQAYPTISHNGDPTKSIQIVLTALQPFIESNWPYPINPFSVSENFVSGTSEYFLELPGGGAPDPRNGPPLIAIRGPIQSFRITELYTGGVFSFDQGSAGYQDEWIYIDCRPDRRTVIKVSTFSLTAGTTNVYDKVEVGSVFPSTQSLKIDNIVGASGSPGMTKFEMQWKWAWL